MMRAEKNLAFVGRSLPDGELVALAKEGSEEAYVELCNRHSKLAFMVIQRIMKNREDSEDVLQDSLLKAYVHLNGFDGRAKFSTWLTRISINSALMALRKKSTRAVQSLDELTETFRDSIPGISSLAQNPESQVVSRQLSAQLKVAVDRLPPVLRGVTLLRQSGDLSVAEVAALAGITVSAAKSRLLRAKAELLNRMVGSSRSAMNGSTEVRENAQGRILARRRSRLAMGDAPVEQAA